MLGRFFKKPPAAPVPAPDHARIALEARYAGVAFGTDVQVIGLETIRIRHGSCIGDRVWLNDCLRDEPGRLEIGDFAVLGPNVFVADPYQPILQQGVTAGRSVIIEENCWLGMQAKVFGNVTVGRGLRRCGGGDRSRERPSVCGGSAPRRKS